MVDEEKIVAEEEVVAEEAPVIEAEEPKKSNLLDDGEEPSDYAALTKEELQAEQLLLLARMKKTLVFVILNASFFVGATILLQIPVVNFFLGVPLAIAGVVFSILGIIMSVKLLIRSKHFADPNNLLSADEKKAVQNVEIFAIIALISFIILV